MTIKDRAVNLFRLLAKRFKAIVLYTLLFAVFLSTLDYVGYKYALPDNWFVRNYTMTVFPTTEHSDVSVRVCRDRRGNYLANGVRTIYIIPEGKTIDEKQAVGKYTLNNVSIDGERCENLTIKVTQFDHSAGRYQAVTNIQFEAKYGRQVKVEFKSNVYEILPLNDRDLEAQIEELREKLRILEELQGTRTANNTTATNRQQTTSPQTQPQTPNNSVAQNDPPNNNPQTVQPEPQPEQPGFVRRTLNGVRDLLGI